jgi:hypothetical protein
MPSPLPITTFRTATVLSTDKVVRVWNMLTSVGANVCGLIIWADLYAGERQEWHQIGRRLYLLEIVVKLYNGI